MKGNTESILAAGVSRRKFLSYASLAGAGMFIASCRRDDDKKDPMPDTTVNLGSGDAGTMNYLFAMEQLQAAFYIKVCDSFYGGISDLEKSLLRDISEHEIGHREFYRNLLGDPEIIRNLEFTFDDVDFNSRVSVLSAASGLKELSVAGYNGVVQLISATEYVEAVTKIASVEARHAAVLLEFANINTFADYTNGDGMDNSKTPNEVLAIADKHFRTKVSAQNLPKA